MTLWLVGVPLGNSEDISSRAKAVLGRADIVLAEDTRSTHKLLTVLGLGKKTLVPFYKEIEDRKTSTVLAWLRDGKEVALVSEAGMPLLSDPGWKLVSVCNKAGIETQVVPGPSAFLASLIKSGFPLDRVLFYGFPAKQKTKVTRDLVRLKVLAPMTVVFYESPVRVKSLIETLFAVLPDSSVALVRELTKTGESIVVMKEKDFASMWKKVYEKGACTVVWRMW